MYEEILRIIPEFNEIQNPDLREKSMAVWQEAMQYRNWTPEEMPRFLLLYWRMM
jgi:hypothetical protein